MSQTQERDDHGGTDEGDRQSEMQDRGRRALIAARLVRLVPIVAWLPGFRRGDLRPDLIAGLTSWGVMVPVALAYASLAGLPYINSTFGRDLLDPAFDAERYTFTIGDQGKVPMLGLIGKDRAFGVFGDGSNRRLTALGRGDARANLAAREPETAARMEELCRALYETARYLPFVNGPEKIRGAGR